MLRFLLKVVVTTIALYVAVSFVNGAEITRDVLTVLGIGLTLGVLNALVRPILSVLTCPFYVLTLGLFTFVMNVIILWILERLSNTFFSQQALDFTGFWPMFWVGVLVSLVSFALNMIVGEKD